jgi:hypothetical protein
MKKLSIVRNDFYLSKFILDDLGDKTKVTVSDFKTKTKVAMFKRLYVILRSLISSKKRNEDEQLIFFAMEDILALDNYAKTQNSAAALWLWNPISSMSSKRRFFLLWYCRLNSIKIWTFDKGDASNFGFHYHPQVLRFLKQDEVSYLTTESESHRVFFSGVDKGRLAFLQHVKQQLMGIEVGFDCHLVKDKRKKYQQEELALFSEHYISYEEYLRRASRSTCLLEISQGYQEGLTTRALESLFLNKKLLTNNKDIVHYDFYHENNIYVLGHEKRTLLEFLDAPTTEIDDSIKQQYTIDHLLSAMIK